MVDFFIQENPIPNPNPKRSRDAEESPVLVDYDGFNFPDEQVVHSWTFLGCTVVLLTTLGVALGVGILGFTIYNVVVDANRKPDVEEFITGPAPVSVDRREVEAFSVKCVYDIPTAIAVTPDGSYLISGGGKWGYVDPSLASRYGARGRGNRGAPGPEEDALFGTGLETGSNADAESDAAPEAEESEAPTLGQDFADVAEEKKGPSVELDDDLGPVNTSIYAIDRTPRPIAPSGRLTYNPDGTPAAHIYFHDHILLGKNGIRQAQDLLEEEGLFASGPRGLEVDTSVMLQHGDSTILPDLVDDPTEAYLNVESLDERRKRVWNVSRPGYETYPVAIWSVKSMEPLVVFWEHEFPVSAIAIAPNGKQFVSTDIGGTAILWSLEEVEKDGMITEFGKHYSWKLTLRMLPTHRQEQGMGRVVSLHAVTFTPSGDQLVFAATAILLDESGNPAGECGALILWDIKSWKEVLRYRQASSRVDTWFQTLYPVGKYTDLRFTPNGKYIIAGAGGVNSGVYWFDTSGNGRPMANLNKQRQRESTRSFLDPSALIKSNLLAGVSEHEYPNAEYVVLDISRDGRCVVSADNLGRMVFWSFTPNNQARDRGISCIKIIGSDDAITRNIRTVRFSSDNRYIFASGEDVLLFNGHTRIFDYIGDFQTTNMTLEGGTFSVLSWWFTPDNNYLLAGCDDHRIRIWRMDELPIAMRFASGAKRPSAQPQRGDKQTDKPGEKQDDKQDGQPKSERQEEDDVLKPAEKYIEFDARDRNPDRYDERGLELRNEIGDPLSNDGNRSLDSHNPLDKRLRQRSGGGR